MTEQAKQPEPVGRYHLATNQFGNAFMAGPNASGDYVKASDYADLAARVEHLEAALRARPADHEDQAEWWASIKDHENSEYHTSAAADIRKALEEK